jgi:co-chaperonin GroES (HSP10)
MSEKFKALGENLFNKKGGSVKFVHKIKELKPLHDTVLVKDMNFGDRKLSSGIVLLGDDGKTDGIRPRWARVYAVGPDQQDVNVGQWILLEHGRWSRGLTIETDDGEFVIHRADPKCIIFVSDTAPALDETISTAVHAERKER